MILTGHQPAPGPAFLLVYGPYGLTVSGYRLPATPIRHARKIGFHVAPRPDAVRDRSIGSGKSTLVDAVATALQPVSGVVTAVTAVLADDYVSTETVSGNTRLASPTASDQTDHDA